MATIKSYTDLQQSKKLAEILPLESADMIYTPIMDIDSMSSSGFLDIPEYYSFNEFKNNTIKPLPCWSLAALLGVLPDELGGNHFLTLEKEGKEYCCCYEDANGNSFRHCFSDNPIDACVAMIEKLHELNLL